MLEIRNLSTFFQTRAGDARAVDDISFAVQGGENFGLVGESGCGKTTAVKSIIKLLPPNGRIVAGQILFRGQDLVSVPPEEIRRIRW
jgi:ABC-type dipeptide/oligopeptide/nickel transport system ATPase component